MRTDTRRIFYFVLLALLVLLMMPCVGMKWIFPWDTGLDGQVFWDIRLPRVLAGFLCGAGLAIGGMAFQAMFRSPLATPYTLGVASGASFGTVLAILLQSWFSVLMDLPPGLSALGGALLTAILIYNLAGLKRDASVNTLLLAGVALNYFFGSAVAFIQYLSDFTNVFRILHSLLGGLEGVGYPELLQLACFVLPGILLLAFLPDELNLLGLGEELAKSRGLSVKRVHQLLFLGTSLIVGGVVSVCGPIGFVGMMAPHIGRLMVGGEHRRLIPVTILLGGSLLTLCDTLARSLIAPAEIPVGVITALLGCPFFLWLLLRQNRVTLNRE
jgi:iron complex transport system permease protein